MATEPFSIEYIRCSQYNSIPTGLVTIFYFCSGLLLNTMLYEQLFNDNGRGALIVVTIGGKSKISFIMNKSPKLHYER